MPSIEITTEDRRSVDLLMEFVRREVRRFPVEARMVFAVEVLRHMKPELDELKRNAASQRGECATDQHD